MKAEVNDHGAALDRAEIGARAPGFLAARWRGEVPLATLFWRDMILFATLFNLAMMTASLVLLELGYPLWLVIAVFAAPLPLNVFLVACVWRTADRSASRYGHAAKLSALVWLVVATVL
ncbi:hypothetical protein [Aquamicrobium sp. LC103]|uniref:hypothetical protein n=1 Tax=Aquamicrobium sp. LC103 TaxID=1120658 RepID=UPI00069B4DE0|nr:hypothetical protein [Aquamicrobium sp. LC103]TKT79045.1 hypothetical protein XW59_008900 [Aquamicrobium sp. LC103]